MRLIGTIQDISARRRDEAARQRLEARLFQSQKLESLGVLAGVLASIRKMLNGGMDASAVRISSLSSLSSGSGTWTIGEPPVRSI